MLPFKNYKGPPNENATEAHRGLMTADMVKRLNKIGLVGPNDSITQLSAPDGYAVLSSKLNSYLISNAYYDDATSQWYRYDTAQPAALAGPNYSGGFLFYTAPAGANPITWTTTTASQANIEGMINAGTISQSSRSVNLAIPATTVTVIHTHALTAGKWLVFGMAGFTMGGVAAYVDIGIVGTQWSTAGLVPAGTFAQVFARPYVITGPATATLQAYAGAACTCAWVFGGAGNATTSITAVRVG